MIPQVCPRCGFIRSDPRPALFCQRCGKCLGKKLTPERQRLVSENLGLAYKVVETQFAAVARSQEIGEVAVFALCEAASRWDERRAKFSTYATWYVRGRLLSEMERRRKRGFTSVPEEAEIGRVLVLSEITTRRDDEGHWEPESRSEEARQAEEEHREEVQARVEAVLRTPWLTEAERTALRMRARGLTNEEVGAAMGHSGAWAGSMIRSAIAKVREAAEGEVRACA